eukprot:COSAG02_NODE_7861_length_2814_cov_18.430141_2_plen_38_part_01
MHRSAATSKYRTDTCLPSLAQGGMGMMGGMGMRMGGMG